MTDLFNRSAEQRVRPMRFVLVFVGLAFFCNPYLSVIDFFSDFIGCALIALGLSRVSLFHRPMREARTAFLRLGIFDLIKTAATLGLIAISGPLERPTVLLSIAFVSATVGLYLSVHAVVALFDGFYHLAVTNDCDALWQNQRHTGPLHAIANVIRKKAAARHGGEFEPHDVREISRTEKILRSTKRFLILREVLFVLPEFTALTASSYTDSGMDNLYEYVNAIRFLAIFPVLIGALIWLTRLCRYALLLHKQKDFCLSLGEADSAFRIAHPGAEVLRRFGTVFVLFAIGVFLLSDFYLDFQNIIPDWWGAVCVLAGLLLVERPAKQRWIGALVTVGYGIVSHLSSNASYAFVTEYSGAEISKNALAAKAYQTMWLLALFEFLLFLAMLAGLMLLLRSVIADRAGYVAKHTDLEFEQRRRSAFLEEFDGELLRVFVFGFLSGLASFLYDYIKEISSKGLFRLMEFFWSIDLALALVFAVLFSFTLANIHRQIRQRFLLSE